MRLVYSPVYSSAYSSAYSSTYSSAYPSAYPSAYSSVYSAPRDCPPLADTHFPLGGTARWAALGGGRGKGERVKKNLPTYLLYLTPPYYYITYYFSYY